MRQFLVEIEDCRPEVLAQITTKGIANMLFSAFDVLGMTVKTKLIGCMPVITVEDMRDENFEWELRRKE